MTKLKMGMVGGGKDAFIGAVHRMAAALDGQIDFVAGALSSTPEKAKASGLELGLAENRAYGTWEEMLSGESALSEDERIDFVSVVTPNHMHFPVSHAFASAGFNVVSDKPLVHTSEQAAGLIEAVEKTGVVFAVTYNYSGYPLIKEAKHLVVSGRLGKVRKIIVEYNQGWLAEEVANKQADWRTDPAKSGVAGAIGDIGSHAEQLVSYVTGLKLDAICADLTTFVPADVWTTMATCCCVLRVGLKACSSPRRFQQVRRTGSGCGCMGRRGGSSGIRRRRPSLWSSSRVNPCRCGGRTTLTSLTQPRTPHGFLPDTPKHF